MAGLMHQGPNFHGVNLIKIHQKIDLGFLYGEEPRKIKQGDVTEIQIPLKTMGMRFHAGVKLKITIKPKQYYPLLPIFTLDPLQPGKKYTFHTGGNYTARLDVDTKSF